MSKDKTFRSLRHLQATLQDACHRAQAPGVLTTLGDVMPLSQAADNLDGYVALEDAVVKRVMDNCNMGVDQAWQDLYQGEPSLTRQHIKGQALSSKSDQSLEILREILDQYHDSEKGMAVEAMVSNIIDTPYTQFVDEHAKKALPTVETTAQDTKKKMEIEDQINFWSSLVGNTANVPLLATMASMVGMINWGGIVSVASNLPYIGGVVAGINGLIGLFKIGVMATKGIKGNLSPAKRSEMILETIQSFTITGIILAAVLFATNPITLLAVSLPLMLGNLIISALKESVSPEDGMIKNVGKALGRLFSGQMGAQKVSQMRSQMEQDGMSPQAIEAKLKSTKVNAAFKTAMFYGAFAMIAATATASSLSIVGAVAAASIAGPIGIILALLMVTAVVGFMIYKKASHGQTLHSEAEYLNQTEDNMQLNRTPTKQFEKNYAHAPEVKENSEPNLDTDLRDDGVEADDANRPKLQ